MVTDPWRVERNDKRNSFILARGNEWCYDALGYLREWPSEQDAKDWAERNLRPPFVWKPLGQLKLGGMP